MAEELQLFHASSDERLDSLLEEGVVPKVDREEDVAYPEAIENNVVYLFRPEDVYDFTAEEYTSRPFVECAVPAEDIYVAKWGSGLVEKASVGDLDRVCCSYTEFASGEADYDSAMFLYPGRIPPERIRAVKW